MTQDKYQYALEQFRGFLSQRQSKQGFQEIISSRDGVHARYHDAFQYENIMQLPEETFRSFLYIENNHHWSGLYRKALRLCNDMDALRNALAILLNPSTPIDKAYANSIGSLNGLGKGIGTAILMVAYPGRFGVWNNTSEAALRKLEIWPNFPRGANRGEKYEKINQLLNNLAHDLNIDLWTLDALMWAVLPEEEIAKDEEIPSLETPLESYSRNTQGFGLERHLHDFLFDNWDQSTLGKEWELYSEGGDGDAGYEYPTDVGRIDLLAHHRSKPEWLIIELKRNKTSDTTLGQLLRYIGWVKHNLAENKDIVRGLIIAKEADDALRYAVSALDNPNIGLFSYEVEFLLKPVSMNFHPSKK